MKRPLRVLIVEDSEDDAELLLLELGRAGYEVTHQRVQSADEMRAALAGQSWDLVVSDYSMPDFSAPAALALLKASGTDLPFIILSGTVGEEAAVDALKAGAHDFLVKERLARLQPAIERELRDAEERRARRQVEQERAQLVERLHEAVRVRDEFLSIASHELKTPLTSMMLQVQGLQRLLERGRAEPAVAGKLKLVEAQVQRLAKLVSDLLDVSRIVNGRLVLTQDQIDLSRLLREISLRFEEALRTARCSLQLEAPEPVVGFWDPQRIEEVMINLLANAMKYGAGQPIQASTMREGDFGVLRISDRGIGIAPADQARIFERFERAVPSNHYGGLGLGLWITREIVQAHGGEICVESTPGTGSTFTIRLPLTRPLTQSETVARRIR